MTHVNFPILEKTESSCIYIFVLIITNLLFCRYLYPFLIIIIRKSINSLVKSLLIEVHTQSQT